MQTGGRVPLLVRVPDSGESQECAAWQPDSACSETLPCIGKRLRTRTHIFNFNRVYKLARPASVIGFASDCFCLCLHWCLCGVCNCVSVCLCVCVCAWVCRGINKAHMCMSRLRVSTCVGACMGARVPAQMCVAILEGALLASLRACAPACTYICQLSTFSWSRFVHEPWY